MTALAVLCVTAAFMVRMLRMVVLFVLRVFAHIYL
jgi:hypothetical protein